MNLNNNQFSNFLGKAVDRVARVGREVRDIPTAISTALDPKTNNTFRPGAIKDIANQLNDPFQAMGGQGQSSAYKNQKAPSYNKAGKYVGSYDTFTKQDVTNYRKPYSQRNDAYESAGHAKDKAAIATGEADKAYETAKKQWKYGGDK
jgi:hypothetical protein